MPLSKLDIQIEDALFETVCKKCDMYGRCTNGGRCSKTYNERIRLRKELSNK